MELYAKHAHLQKRKEKKRSKKTEEKDNVM